MNCWKDLSAGDIKNQNFFFFFSLLRVIIGVLLSSSAVSKWSSWDTLQKGYLYMFYMKKGKNYIIHMKLMGADIH